MNEFQQRYLDPAKKGKAYQTEQDYMSDQYAFLDMCLVTAGMLAQKDSGQEDSRQEDAAAGCFHIRELPGTLAQAYQSVTRQSEEPDAGRRKIIQKQLRQAGQYLKERLAYTPYCGRRFKMRELSRELSLSDFEQFLLLMAAAGSYDAKYGQIFADLQGADSLNRPAFHMAFFLYSLFADTEDAEKTMGQLMHRQGVLAESFLEVTQGVPGRPETFCFTLNRRTSSYFHGYEELDRKTRRFAFYRSHRQPPADIYIRIEQLERLERSMEGFLQNRAEYGNVLHLYGPKGNGKKLFLQTAAQKLGYGMIFADVEKLAAASYEETETCVASLVQESILLHACLCFIDTKDREETEGEEQRRQAPGFPKGLSYLLETLAEKLHFFIWTSPEKCHYLSEYPVHLLCMEQPVLTVGERIVLWKKFSEDYPVSSRTDLIMCANKYILSVHGIKEVLKTADFIRAQNEREQIGPEEISLAVKQQSPNQLGQFAVLVPAVYTWEDLVVSPEQKHQMHLICSQLQYRNVVGEEWGFFKKTAYGRGICALFYGAPGTGKTMAVQVMANELGLDLYRVDLSQLVSKYIGETEKNISTLFKKAKNINALLFFDEADALFAKRSEVRDSHDRNANAETAHLLQKLEDYDGITILATNYINNIDDAFKRRIKFMVNFSFPEPEVRLQLWNTILPADTPCEEELDFEYYAEHFELSGSSIKEILTNAAFIAAAQHEKLANRHVIEAVRLNFSKYGKVLTDHDFGYLC